MKLPLSQKSRERLVAARLAGRQVEVAVHSRDVKGRFMRVGTYTGPQLSDWEDGPLGDNLREAYSSELIIRVYVETRPSTFALLERFTLAGRKVVNG